MRIEFAGTAVVAEYDGRYKSRCAFPSWGHRVRDEAARLREPHHAAAWRRAVLSTLFALLIFPVAAAAAVNPSALPRDRAAALDSITVEGRRIHRPGVHEIFERNLGPGRAIRFVSSDRGDGRRCTRVLPFGYQKCTHAPTAFVRPLG